MFTALNVIKAVTVGFSLYSGNLYGVEMRLGRKHRTFLTVHKTTPYVHGTPPYDTVHYRTTPNNVQRCPGSSHEFTRHLHQKFPVHRHPPRYWKGLILVQQLQTSVHFMAETIEISRAEVGNFSGRGKILIKFPISGAKSKKNVQSSYDLRGILEIFE